MRTIPLLCWRETVLLEQHLTSFHSTGSCFVWTAIGLRPQGLAYFCGYSLFGWGTHAGWRVTAALGSHTPFRC